MRCAGERNPFASALPACLFPHFTSHKMLLQVTRDVPVRIYRSPKEKGTAALLLQEHKFPSVLLDHGAQTHTPGQGGCRRGAGWSACDMGHHRQSPWGQIGAGSTGCDTVHCCSFGRDGQGLAAAAAALTAVTPPCSPYNLALLFLPPPSFIPRIAVGESFNTPGLCVSSWCRHLCFIPGY